jgi:RNA polymerase sigma-70 factor (ECF subfamily)
VDYSTLSPEKLILACIDTGDTGAWEEFVRRFHRLIATVALRIARRWGGASPQLVDDLVQETYLKLCENNFQLLRTFQFRHDEAIYGYIKVLTANLVHDHFKSIRSQKRGGAVESAPSDSIDAVPEKPSTRTSTQSAEQNIFVREVDACLRAMDSHDNPGRDRRIFWLYYQVGLAASAIAALPTIGLSTKGVESTLLRLTRHVRERLTAKSMPASTSTAKAAKGIEQAESL